MKTVTLVLLAFAALAASPAAAQFATALPAAPKLAGVTTAVPAGAFLGSDDCSAPHTFAGTGDVTGVPFTTGTTGSAGQNEAVCYAFGSTTIDNDVWYDWTAATTGDARFTTCGSTSVDTKIAVWPDHSPSSCPADGTSLGCNDDVCGLQSRVTWSVTAGSTYTLQIGTFPGAAGGSGSFEITHIPPLPCGRYDDGTTENALGLIAGGETGWLHFQDCLATVDRIDTAYYTPTGTTPPNAAKARVVCYEDADCDGDPTTPAGGMTLMWSLATTVTNGGTDILNPYPYPPPGDLGGTFTNTASSRCTFVMVAAGQPAGEFPGPMDQTNPTPNAWVVGQTPTGATLDITNLNANNVAPLQMQAIGYPTAWVLRAIGSESGGDDYPRVCFGGAGCPCGNDGDGEGGCQHTVGSGGTTLAGSGAASLSGDGFVLTATRTRNAPGIFFQANNTLVSPPAFGDGLRCCGVNVVRIGTYLAAGNTTNTDTGNQIGGIGPPISQHPGNASLSAGDTRCYQYWHRDPPSGVCGSGFNLSNAVQATWVP